MTADAVVIGTGLAGLTAAVGLAEEGLETVLVAKGIGATHLAPATIDVLGHAPELVERPGEALASFLAERPDHPYARVGRGAIEAGAAWLGEHVPAPGSVGSLEENLLLPTAVGVPKPTAFAPQSMAGGDLRPGGRFAFVGLRALKDFYPSYLADNLSQAKLPSGTTVEARSVQLLDPGDEADVSPLGYARQFEDPVFRQAVAAELLPLLEPGEAVGFPAVLGLDEHLAVWGELQDRLERPVFEVPTLPPSVSGIRLYRALAAAFRRAGGRSVMGSVAIGAESGAEGMRGVVIQAAAARPTTLEARWFVLATGGLAEGAISLGSDGEVRENVLGLPVSYVPAAGAPRFLPRYFDDQPMGRAGLAVDASLRPLGPHGDPAFPNLFAAGAVLGGAEPWREHSGNGLALATGFAAASAIIGGAS